jgi:glucose-6-phosphate-specific signal transduction histidine kinase
MRRNPFLRFARFAISRFFALSNRFQIPVRNPRFWVIQALVLFLDISHLFLEHQRILMDGSELYLLSVSIYLIPAVYAGIGFGLSGAVATTIWALVLSSPEITKHDNGTQLGIVIQFGIILVMASIVGVRVARERSAAEAALRANTRLSRLNATASAVTQSLDLGQVLQDTLRAKLDLVARQVAWIRLLPTADSPGVTTIDASQVEVPSVLNQVQDGLTLAACLTGMEQRDYLSGAGAHTAVTPLISDGEVVGALGVTYLDKPISADEYQVLEAIGSQLGVALNNIRNHAGLHEAVAALSIANENLETYIELATEAQEEERKRLSRELHDDTMQSLVLTLSQIDTATTSELPDESRVRLAGAQAILTETLVNLRRYCRDLRPSLIDDLGLVDAIDWLVGDLRLRQIIDIDLSVQGSRRRLSNRYELLVFRIVQEALHNVERHAQAASVQVNLLFNEEELVVEIVDNGSGTIPSGRSGQHPAEYGLGLRGMEERTKLLQGTLVIESKRGRGTKVALFVPLIPDDHHRE